ncbi:MAG: hypothetical protein QXF35_00305 [Candidatus Bilamarchaeaceae archaeon]
MKGQIAAEFFVTLGVVLLFTIPVVLLLFSISQLGYEDSTLAQADAAARSLAETLNLVYAQGSGASRIMLLSTPPNTESINIGNKEVTISIKTSKGFYTASAPIFASIDQQKVIKRSGLFQLLVYNKDGKVSVTEVS